jgi:hypothetical protein
VLLPGPAGLSRAAALGPGVVRQRLAYAANTTVFVTDFATAMVRMGNLGPPMGNAAEVRLNCTNPPPNLTHR